MQTVNGVLDTKGRDVWSISSQASVFDAIDMMANKGIGALLVMDGEAPVGIMSERDYARKVILMGRSSRETQVSAIMTARVVYAKPDMTVEQAMAVMTDKRIRHLPVMVDNKVVGIVSLGDLVKSIVVEQQFTIEQLERYIGGAQ